MPNRVTTYHGITIASTALQIASPASMKLSLIRWKQAFAGRPKTTRQIRLEDQSPHDTAGSHQPQFHLQGNAKRCGTVRLTCWPRLGGAFASLELSRLVRASKKPKMI